MQTIVFQKLQKDSLNDHLSGWSLRLSSHIFSHTFCTNMVNNSMKPKAMQYIVGHKRITSTPDHYLSYPFENNEFLNMRDL